MPADHRRRRFRRPGFGHWLDESLPTLRIELAPQVRQTLTAWMRLYGDANNLPGLATGPIETRFARLRQHAEADGLVVWTTPGRWASGEGLSLRFPALQLELTCSLGDGHLVASKVAQVPPDARPPEKEPGAVGVTVHAERITLPPEDTHEVEPDEGVARLEMHFARLAGRRWGGFVEPLRAALDAEAVEDEARTQRLTVPYQTAKLQHGGEEDVWELIGLPVEALRAYDDGEWLELLDEMGRSRTTARVIAPHIRDATLVVGVRSAGDPPRAGVVRPRSRRKILEQKRFLLEELANPTGNLPNLVRLVAAPSSMPMPRQERPEHFVNPAVMRNRSQVRAVSLALGLEDGQALLIQGPPGTGKSTTAAEIDVQLILRDPAVRILVCSHSNHGTDNMLMKVLPFLEDASERIARIGFYDRIAKDARPFYAPPDADLGDRNIIFTTIDALALQDIAGARVYDYVVLDEANRAGVLDSLLALARGRRMILVGDSMQLQPVMSEAEQQIVAAASTGRRGNGKGRRSHGPVAFAPLPGGNNVIGKSLFAWIMERHFAPAATVLLDQQNRMHPAIGELVSRVFYNNRVRTGPAAPRRGPGLPLIPSPVTWVDTRSLRGSKESRAGGTSLFNVGEARLVSAITRYISAQAAPGLTIGVITAYAEQREVLRRMMTPQDWPAERELEIDTVDAFEGREKDMIVLSLVRSNRRRDVGFLSLEQRLNVAVSRARRLIVIVGDTATLRGGYFHHLINAASSVGQVIPAPKLLAQLGGRTPATGSARRKRREHRAELAAERAAAATTSETIEQVVAPTEAPQQEGAVVPGEGRRRRRRRAWERRRERLRAAAQNGEPTAAAAEARSPDGPESAVVGPREQVEQAPRVSGEEGEENVAAATPDGPRRRRRLLRGAARSTDETVVAAELPAPRRRAARARTVAAPSPAAEPVEAAAAPVAPETALAGDASEAATPPRRAPRTSRRRTAAEAPVEAAVPVSAEEAPALLAKVPRRTPRDKVQEPAEVPAAQPRPAPAPDAAAEAPAAKPTRAPRAPTARKKAPSAAESAARSADQSQPTEALPSVEVPAARAPRRASPRKKATVEAPAPNGLAESHVTPSIATDEAAPASAAKPIRRATSKKQPAASDASVSPVDTPPASARAPRRTRKTPVPAE